jgi:hypothetical protein
MSYFSNVTASFNPANNSAFGTLETAELTPTFQGDFVYGLNTQLWAAGVVNGTGATVDTDAARLRIQSGTASGGYAWIQPKRPARYRAGQGTVARFTPLFTTGVANNVQLWGMGTIVTMGHRLELYTISGAWRPGRHKQTGQAAHCPGR